MPQNAAGRMTEPLVCVPSAPATNPAATAAADPLDDPPGVWPIFQGLRVFAGTMNAASVVTVLPNMIPPADSRRTTTSAVTSGTYPAYARHPISVGMPAV